MLRSKTFWVIAFCVLKSLNLFGNTPAQREVILLSGQWSFCVDSLNRGENEKWFAHSFPSQIKRDVQVPHTWNTEKGLEKYWGKCWYSRSFEILPYQISKTIRLQFDGVNHDAIIYVNGIEAGRHIGSGFTKFYINISSFIKKGKNILTVCVDNSPSRNNIPFLKTFDWANDGGIYRNVYLIATDPHAIQNIMITAAPKSNGGTAAFDIHFLDTANIHLTSIKLHAIITEENQLTKHEIFNGDLKGNFDNGVFFSSMFFNKIKAWNFDEPNLYKIKISELLNGKQIDETSAIFGFRSITIKNNRYVLNGEAMRLMGVEWMPGSNLKKGMAETHEDMEKNLRLMKNANCIFTRFHWQQDDFVFDWCDRHGMLIQEEIPYWGYETNINDTLLSLGFQQLQEMISTQYNHPGIIAWGIGNELASHDSNNIASLKKLFLYAKSLDSTRLVNYVSNALQYLPDEKNPVYDAGSYFDMMMFNEYYSTWYGQSVDSVAGVLDKISKAYDNKALTISEWGLCEPVFKGGDVRRGKEMVQQNTIYSEAGFVAGAIYFCLNDYRTHMGEDFTYNYPQRVHGVCDIHLQKKPSYDSLQKISSPVLIKQIIPLKANQFKIILEGKSGIPAYTVRNYILTSSDNKILIPEIEPGQTKSFIFTSHTGQCKIERPTGFEVLSISLK